MIRIGVRRASADEASLVQEHLAAAHRESAEYRGHLDKRVGNRSSSVVVTIDDVVVGSACYEDSSGVREITHIHVVRGFRDVGAGDSLMEWLVSDAGQAGLTAVRSSALPGDRSTKNLFERHGLVARAILVEKIL